MRTREQTVSAVADELLRLQAEADGILELARQEYEAALRHVDACRANVIAAQDAMQRIADRAGRVTRPRVLMAGEQRRYE